LAHPEDTESGGPCRQPEGPVGIGPLEDFDHEEVPGDEGHLGREHHGSEHGEEELIAAWEVAFSEGIAGEGREEEDADGADGSEVEGIDEGPAIAEFEEELAVGGEVEAVGRPEVGFFAKEFMVLHEGADEHIIEGEEEEDSQDDEEDIEEEARDKAREDIFPLALSAGRVGNERHRENLLLAHPAALEADLDEGDGDDEGTDEEAEGGGIAVALLGDADIVKAEHEGFGSASRAAPSEHIGLVEHIEEADGSDDGEEEDDRAEEGQSDAPENLPAISAVDHSGLIDFGFDALEAAEEEEDIVADAAPVGEEDDDGFSSPGRAAEPFDGGEADGSEGLVDPAEGVIEELGEDDGDDDRVSDVRKEVDSAKDAATPEVLDIEDDGERDSEEDTGREEDIGELEGIDEGLFDVGVFEHDAVVFEANVFHGAVATPLAEAELEGPGEGVEGEDGKADEKGRDKEVIDPVFRDLFPEGLGWANYGMRTAESFGHEDLLR